eukprot:TRINITY_DN4966_c0_g1_i4.p1 TRINITY_DN4966_c0_g1~~TRINITY_DN4966_c0_g1_i4.p1  ORF type:complete len:303 (-),score=56.38 TRINITY_DN4966_c0_g1_i4:84-992(-)
MKAYDLPDDINELKQIYLAKHQELQSTKQSLANLATTVVRQDKHIKALVQYIQSGKAAQSQQDSLPSGGYSNSQGGDTQDDDEEDEDFMADVLKQQIDNAKDYLNQLDEDSSLPYQVLPMPAPRASSPFQPRASSPFQPPRSSTPVSQQSYGSQNLGERRVMNKPPRPTTATVPERNPLSARREQRESILTNMARVPPVHREENGRSETPTRSSGGTLYNRQRANMVRRPASVTAMRAEKDGDYFESSSRYGGIEREFQRIPGKMPPKASGGRKDLLGSIEGFKKGKLKKATTVGAVARLWV